MHDAAIDRCDMLDLLEEAAVRRRPVEFELHSGRHFIDAVHDVVTEHGQDFVVFTDRPRLPVAEIARCARADTDRTASD